MNPRILTPPRRVLMIASAFPPTGGPGVQRTAKFAKFLPDFGWIPVVWTLPPSDDLPRDESLSADLPESVTVHRVTAHELRSGHASNQPRSWRTITRSVAATFGLTGAARNARTVRGNPHPAPRRDPRPDACRVRRLAPDLVPPLELDDWARASVEPCLELIRQSGIRAIYSTFSPPANHLLALRLQETTSLPWVADFRDLWTDDYRYSEPDESVQEAHLAFQKEILTRADIVLAVSDRQRDLLAAHVPHRRDRFQTITNGFDSADFPAWSPGEPAQSSLQTPVFTVAHVGRLDRWRTRRPLFDALRTLARRPAFKRNQAPWNSVVPGTAVERSRPFPLVPDRPIDGSAGDRSGAEDRPIPVHLRVVGHASREVRADLDATGLDYTYTGYVDHRAAILEMCAADVLLLCVPEGPNADSVIPAKLFEYLAARRPILVIGPPDGEAGRIVRKCRTGVTVRWDSTDITDALENLYRDQINGRRRPNCSDVDLNPFHRRTLSAMLAATLDDLTRGERPERNRDHACSAGSDAYEEQSHQESLIP